MGATLIGALLGKMIVGDRLRVVGADRQPFASLSANPDAATVDPIAERDCIFCPDSFGVGAKLRDRHSQPEYAYPYAPVELGESATSKSHRPANNDEPNDNYRYGGTFADSRTFARPSAALNASSSDNLLPESRSLGSKPLERPGGQASAAEAGKAEATPPPPARSAPPSGSQDETKLQAPPEPE